MMLIFLIYIAAILLAIAVAGVAPLGTWRGLLAYALGAVALYHVTRNAPALLFSLLYNDQPTIATIAANPTSLLGDGFARMFGVMVFLITLLCADALYVGVTISVLMFLVAREVIKGSLFQEFVRWNAARDAHPAATIRNVTPGNAGFSPGHAALPPAGKDTRL